MYTTPSIHFKHIQVPSDFRHLLPPSMYPLVLYLELDCVQIIEVLDLNNNEHLEDYCFRCMTELAGVFNHSYILKYMYIGIFFIYKCYTH